MKNYSMANKDMEIIRGKVPLNIDHINNLNGHSKFNPQKQFNNRHHLHNGKTINIFEENLYSRPILRGYGSTATPQKVPEIIDNQMQKEEIRKAVAYVQANNPNAVDHGAKFE
jgi:hypothetical protein